MKAIIVLFISMSVLLSTECFGNELIQGHIKGNLDSKVRILLGDKAIVDIGKKEGIIKGDILNVYRNIDTKLLDPIGRCAIVAIYDTTAICEVVKMKVEIENDTVTIDKLVYNDPHLFAAIFQMLTKVVEPYAPQKDITVYIHSIYDENNNITKFSETLQKEIKKVFYQKKRIKPAGKDVARALFAYLPSEYAESNKVIEDYIRKDNIDVIITGSYRVKNDKVEISLYKVDKNWEDIIVDTTVNSAPYGDLLSTVTLSYKSMEKEQNILCSILFKPVHYKATDRDERNDIIVSEAKKDPFLEYSLKRIDFNIISPVGFKLKIDNIDIGFEKSNEYELSLPTGKHEITASFKKGYYFNDSLLFTNDNEIKKSIVLLLDKPENLVIEAEVNPVPGRENIDFKVYKKVVRTKQVIKPVLQKETVKQVETFKD
ncbi:MAG: hypothetical protein C0399_03780 [Syntrophus sp. (in: bacteria)]|nr:hypothetical protein [Syntrophus sp. (in: bacteria)]